MKLNLDQTSLLPRVSVTMASRLPSLSLAVVVVAICVFAAHVDGTKCSTGYATCTYGRICKTNLNTDLNHCGRCSSKCPCGPHANAKCTKGKCSIDCDKTHGWCDCDRNPHTGCEINIHSDPKNCGKCGTICPTPPNFVASCAHGVCKKTCKYGFKLCGSECVKVTNDVNNCGSCGYECPTSSNGMTSCVGGSCVLDCDTGTKNCNDTCADLSQDILNCGSCGNACPLDSNGTICYQGVCGPAQGCFPGDATVTLVSGGVKQMIDLALGDKVAVMGRGGRIVYEDVYAFGHRDASTVSSFVQLTVKPIDADMSDSAVESRTLELTAFHFVPVCSGKAGKLTYKRAQDVTVSDKLWSSGSTLVTVTTISQVQKPGLYNPFTLGGTILVNGVVASTHSEWFLDDLFHSLSLLHWLPSVYQTLLLPVRLLYSVLGKEAYVALYHWLEAFVDVTVVGSKHGGSVVAASAALAAVFFMAITSSRRA